MPAMSVVMFILAVATAITSTNSFLIVPSKTEARYAIHNNPRQQQQQHQQRWHQNRSAAPLIALRQTFRENDNCRQKKKQTMMKFIDIHTKTHMLIQRMEKNLLFRDQQTENTNEKATIERMRATNTKHDVLFRFRNHRCRHRFDLNSPSSVLLHAGALIGFARHAGFLLVSTVLVQQCRVLFFSNNTKNNNTKSEDAVTQASTGDQGDKFPGLLNRCPWPFIFFHDLPTAFKDTQTWVVLVWFILARLAKLVENCRRVVTPV